MEARHSYNLITVPGAQTFFRIRDDRWWAWQQWKHWKLHIVTSLYAREDAKLFIGFCMFITLILKKKKGPKPKQSLHITIFLLHWRKMKLRDELIRWMNPDHSPQLKPDYVVCSLSFFILDISSPQTGNYNVGILMERAIWGKTLTSLIFYKRYEIYIWIKCKMKRDGN